MNKCRLSQLLRSLSTESLTYLLLTVAMLGLLAVVFIPKASGLGMLLS